MTLHEVVSETTKGIRGLGPLYRYDTACTIGIALGLRPMEVYLHAGTRVGASRLVNVQGRQTLRRSELPLPLSRLPAAKIEDILCLNKDAIPIARSSSGH